MTAQPSLHAVPDIDPSIRRKRLLARAIEPLPLWLAQRNAASERRHRHLVQLEALHAETPVWCFRQRRAIRRTIAAHLPSMWS